MKTADDLKIKGLAEVTWRDDEPVILPPPPIECHSPVRLQENIPQNHQHSTNETEPRSSSPNITNRPPARMPMLTPMPSSPNLVAEHHQPHHHVGLKRKRGRPPLDESYETFNS